MQPRVAIIYLSYHCEPYIEDAVSAVKKLTYPKDRLAFVIVDNPHPEYGPSVRFLQENILPMSGKEMPQIVLLPQAENLGFSAGNNAGIKWAIENGFDYVYFHNNDGFLEAGALDPLVNAMEADRKIGAAQSLMLLYPETGLINSAGNSYQFLGLAYCGNFRHKKESVDLNKIAEVGYASGAALMLRARLLNDYGAWDPDFFLYHEDVEYSLRLKSLGFKTVIVPESVFYHKYNFSRSQEKFYYIERNRWAVLLMYYKWPTLVLLLPIGLALEIGMMIFAASHGWFGKKMAAYKYWLSGSNIKLWLAKRRKIQTLRNVSDRALLARATGTVIFDEKSIDSPLLRYFGNPLMAACWWVARKIIFW